MVTFAGFRQKYAIMRDRPGTDPATQFDALESVHLSLDARLSKHLGLHPPITRGMPIDDRRRKARAVGLAPECCKTQIYGPDIAAVKKHYELRRFFTQADSGMVKIVKSKAKSTPLLIVFSNEYGSGERLHKSVVLSLPHLHLKAIEPLTRQLKAPPGSYPWMQTPDQVASEGQNDGKND
jgi:hypothetical protein